MARGLQLAKWTLAPRVARRRDLGQRSFMLSSKIAVRSIIGGLVLLSAALCSWFILPIATDDERSVLTKMARSAPVTTCVAVKTVEPSGYHPRWAYNADGSRAAELERAQLQSGARNASLSLDAASTIDNLLRYDCLDRASLSIPSFFGNFAFAQITGKRERTTVAYQKVDGLWEVVGHYTEFLNAIVI